ncbi:membrane protein [Bryobacterales bacterium F-183]|nr:membrane protein [Bryobacterales bacterium F-183]
MEVRDLPAVNATLNATATVLLIYGYRLIRAGKREAHKKAMLAAFGVSVLFLLCYLVYHFQVRSVPFEKPGAIRYVYFTILGSHVILAMFVPVMAAITLWRAYKGQFERHRRIARWTFPIWLYVSITGVLVYLMLYQL